MPRPAPVHGPATRHRQPAPRPAGLDWMTLGAAAASVALAATITLATGVAGPGDADALPTRIAVSTASR